MTIVGQKHDINAENDLKSKVKLGCGYGELWHPYSGNILRQNSLLLSQQTYYYMYTNTNTSATKS